MKNRKIYISFLVILTILLIGAVSAGSDDASDIAVARDEMLLEDSMDTQISEGDSDGGERNQQDDQQQSDPGDLKVEFPETGIVGHGDDRDSIFIEISVPKNSTGNISFYEDADLIGSFELKQKSCYISTDYGTTNVFIFYATGNESDLYEAVISQPKVGYVNHTVRYDNGLETFEKSANINVTYVLGFFDESFYGDGSFEVMLPWEATGDFNVLIDGKKYSTYTKNVDGYKSYYVKLSPLLSIGKHDVRLTYLGDERYPGKTVDGILNVYGKIKIPTYKFTNNEVISIKLPAKAKGSLVVKVYNSKNKILKKFTQELVNGKASISFSKNKFYGIYSNIVATYTGSDYNVSAESMNKVTINPPISLAKKMIKGEKKVLSINLAGKKGVLKLYYKTTNKYGTYKSHVLTKKLTNGKAKIALSVLPAGTHDLKVKFIQTLKSGKKITYVYNRQLQVIKPLKISSDKKLYYGTAKIKVQAYKSGGKVLAGKYIKIKINNKFVKKVRTDKKGIASFKIPAKYKQNSYKITAVYGKHTTSKTIKIYKAA